MVMVVQPKWQIRTLQSMSCLFRIAEIESTGGFLGRSQAIFYRQELVLTGQQQSMTSKERQMR